MSPYNLDAVPILPPIQASDYFNPQPELKKSIASHLDELQAMGGGALGMVGTALGIEGLQKAGQEIYNRNMEESQAGWQRPAVPRVEDVRFSEPGGAGRALDFALYQGPKAVATIGEALGGGWAGGTLAKGLAKASMASTVGAAAEQTLQKQWVKGAVAGGLGTNAAMESSQAFGQMVEHGATPENSLLPALAYGAASSATEAVPGYLMAKHMGWLEPFKDKMRKEILGDAALAETAVKLAQSKLGKFAKGVVAGGTAEGLQEGTQQLLQIAAERVAKDDPVFASLSDEDKSAVLNSVVVGALGGGLVGGPVGLMGGQGSTGVNQSKADETIAKTAPGTSIGDQTWMPGEKQPLPENWRLGAPGPREGQIYDMEGPAGLPPGQVGALPNTDQQAIGQQRKLTGPSGQLTAPSIVSSITPTTETPHLDEFESFVKDAWESVPGRIPWDEHPETLKEGFRGLMRPEFETVQGKNPDLTQRTSASDEFESFTKNYWESMKGVVPWDQLPEMARENIRGLARPLFEAKGQTTEQTDPNEWDQAFGRRGVPSDETDFWNRMGEKETPDQIDPTEWDQAFGTELVPENEIDFWRQMGEDLPGLVVRADGKPYMSQQSAEAAARRNGVDGPAIKIKGGYAVQPWTTPPVRPLSDKAQLNPTEPLGRIEQDPRLQDPEVRARMRQLADQAGWEQDGGRIIRDASGKVVDRTKWLPKRDWWTNRPRDVKPHHVQSGMAKIEKGEPLQTRERRAVAWLASMASADLHEENPAKWNLGEPTNAQQKPSTSTPDGSRSTQSSVRQEGGDLTEGRQGVQPSGQGQEPQVASPDWERAQGEVEPNPFEGGSEFKFGKNAPQRTSFFGPYKIFSKESPSFAGMDGRYALIAEVGNGKLGIMGTFNNAHEAIDWTLKTPDGMAWVADLEHPSILEEDGTPATGEDGIMQLDIDRIIPQLDSIPFADMQQVRSFQEEATNEWDSFMESMEKTKENVEEINRLNAEIERLNSLPDNVRRNELAVRRRAAFKVVSEKNDFKSGKDQGHTENPVQNPTTRERLESVLQDLTGRTSHWRVHIHESAPQGADSSTYGWVQRENGKYHVHFILDRIEQGTELSKFLHEVGGHLGIDGLLAPGERKRLVEAIRRWADQPGQEGDIARAALRRVEAAETPAADQDSELIAYFLEEAVQRGVTPTAKGGLGEWFRTLWAAFKRALRKLGVRNVDQLTPQHVVDLAYGAAKLELGTHVHGTATKFRRFDSSFMSAGAGDQWYGWGHYLAKRAGIGKHYMEMVVKNKDQGETYTFDGQKITLSSILKGFSPNETEALRAFIYAAEDKSLTFDEVVNTAVYDLEERGYEKAADWLLKVKDFLDIENGTPQGQLYQVDTNVRPEETMHWDKPLSEQPQEVQDALIGNAKKTVKSQSVPLTTQQIEDILGSIDLSSGYAFPELMRYVLDSIRQVYENSSGGHYLYKDIARTYVDGVSRRPESAAIINGNYTAMYKDAMKLDEAITVATDNAIPSAKSTEYALDLPYISGNNRVLFTEETPGSEIYARMVAVENGGVWFNFRHTSSKAASMFLDSIGIKGMEHWDEPSRSGKVPENQRTTNLVVFNDKNVHIVRRAAEGNLASEGVRYGKLYTGPTVGPTAQFNTPEYSNKVLYDYVNGLFDLKKLTPKLEAVFNRASSKRGSWLEQYHKDKLKPFIDKLADYKNRTGKSDEQVNNEFAAQHIVVDQVNRIMARRASKNAAIQLEQILGGFVRGLPQGDPLKVEVSQLLRDFHKGRMNLMKGWAWGWAGPGQPTHHLTNVQVQEKLMEKLEQFFDAPLTNGQRLWQVQPGTADLRMGWEALKNHGAGMQTKATASQDPVVRAAFEAWMGPEKMARLLDADTIHRGTQGDAAFADLSHRLQEVAADIREQRTRGQLATPQEMTELGNLYTQWVPLRRASYDFENIFGEKGMGGRKMAGRFGTTDVDPPVHVYQNAFAALDLSVTAAEANLARVEMANTIEQDPKVLEGWFEAPTSMPDTQRRFDDQGFAQDTWKPYDKYSIPFSRQGVPWVIPVVKANQRAQYVSAAIQNLAPMDQRPLMTLFKNVNSFLRWVIISANPGFTIMNAPRDFSHAMMNLQAGPLAKYSKEVAGMYKESFLELWGHFVQGRPSQTILEMERAGGRVTFVQSLRPNDQGFGSVERSVKWAQGNKVMRAEMARTARDWLHRIEDLNVAVETVMRLSVWKVGKRHQVALGLTDGDIASLSKDVTVNYDRRGLRSHMVNTYWMFFNASVQGVSGILDAAANGPNKARFFKAIGGVMMAAFLADLAGAALSPGWDDTPEDQKDRFARIPGSDLVLPGDTIAKVPLPWVFNVMWRAGEMLGEVVRGRLSPDRYVAKLIELTINSTNPIGGQVQVAGAEGSGNDFDFGAPSVMTMLSPTALDWFVQIQTNRDAWGRPLGPEKLPGEKYKPESEISWDNTPKFYKWVARELNAWTGGSQGESGLVDWRPSTYKTLVDTLGGGLGQFALGLAGAAGGLIQGDPPSINKVPGAKSFLFTPSGQVGSGLYHERVARVEQARAAEKVLQGQGTQGRPDLEALRASRSLELRIAPVLDDTERQITDLRKQMKEAMKRGQDSRVEVLRERIKKAQTRFNQVWERRVGG